MRLHSAAVLCPHGPLLLAFVEFSGFNAGVESDVAAQIELLIDVTKIATKLVPGREPLGPGPVAPEVLAGELVHRDVGIDAGARIAVPVPNAAQVGAGLEQPHREPQLAQAMELVETGEPRADHQDVERLDGLGFGRHGGLGCHDLTPVPGRAARNP